MTVLKYYEFGQEKYETFVKEYIQESSKSFNDPIQKSKLETFKNAGKAKATRKWENCSYRGQSQCYWKLLAISKKFEKSIDFEFALAYPLSSAPLSLSNPDGSRRVTHGNTKSKLMEMFSQYQEENDGAVEIDEKIFVVDFIAQILVITKEIPERYEQLTLKNFTTNTKKL